MSSKRTMFYLHKSIVMGNRFSLSIFLESLKAAYPDNPDLKSYEVVKLSISDADIGKVHNQVKSPWYLEINPNGRIPAVTIHGFNVFEMSAILLYLADLYDKKRIFLYDPVQQPEEYSEQLQWIFFAHGGIGPMQLRKKLSMVRNSRVTEPFKSPKCHGSHGDFARLPKSFGGHKLNI
ncbi:hypothetical protein CPB84DRAFT_1826222 [Gymnopilus junonius]|uniref:GST N-terminal domain-containing protein n=1 Tax=Gymnopilus junonius TaxID=109634 RepID=A0A9P5NHC6_GYMJU|nr:hypothetical protein CPB84DRAFT_1826222 [Gymnopilus junonius]